MHARGNGDPCRSPGNLSGKPDSRAIQSDVLPSTIDIKLQAIEPRLTRDAPVERNIARDKILSELNDRPQKRRTRLQAARALAGCIRGSDPRPRTIGRLPTGRQLAIRRKHSHADLARNYRDAVDPGSISPDRHREILFIGPQNRMHPIGKRNDRHCPRKLAGES